MRIKLFCFVILLISQLTAQTGSFDIIIDGKPCKLTSVQRKGIEYISARALTEALGGTVFLNPSNGKIELKFPAYFLKFTVQNQFAILTGRKESQPEVIQLPVSPIQKDDDLFVPFDYTAELFTRGCGKSIRRAGAKNERDKTGEIALEKGTEKAVSTSAEKQVSSKTTDAEKSDHGKSVKAEGTKSSAAASRYDIASVRIEEKANGTLIRIESAKKIEKFNCVVNKGVMYLNILGLSADVAAIRSSEPGGLVRKIGARKINSNTQIEFTLKEEYSSYETFREEESGALLISLRTKLSPPSTQTNKLREKWQLNTIVIDAGHGGKDPGAIGLDGTQEKEVNLGIALKLGDLIQKNMKDVKVVFTRSTDKFVELYKRGKIANEKNGNLFISIHCNSTPAKPTNRNGFEVYLLRPGRTKEAISIAERENSVIQYEENPKHYQKLTDENFILVSMAHSSYMRYSEQFSDVLNNHFKKDASLKSNGVKQAGFYVLVGASMPSVLIETGFLSNQKDAALLGSRKGQTGIAESIFNSIKEFREDYEKNLQAEL